MPPLRMVTYNVRYFGHQSRGLGTQERTIRHVARALAHLPGGSPDIIALQEIETFSVRADFVRSKRVTNNATKPQLERFLDHFHDELVATDQTDTYRAFYFPAHEYKLGRRANLYTTGLAILAREDIVVLADNSNDPFDITHRRIQRLARWKQTRICGHVRFEHKNGAHFDLFNTHLSLPAFFTKQMLRFTEQMGHGANQMKEAKSLVEFVESVHDPTTPTVVVGDFNSRPGSPVHMFLTEKRGYDDAFRKLHRFVGSSDYPTAGVGRLLMPLDYVFSLGKVQWLDFDETHTFGLQGGYFHGLSDHVPLVARCRLPLG